MFLRSLILRSKITISLMNFHCSSNPFQLALVSLRRETFSAEITKFNKKKEKKKLSLESLRDRPNWITIVSSVDGKIRGERNWENKIANFETKLSMEIFGRIGIHFKNEITARNLRKARTRCFRVRYTWPVSGRRTYLECIRGGTRVPHGSFVAPRNKKAGIKSSVIDGLKRGKKGRKIGSKVLKCCRTKACLPCAREILIKRKRKGEERSKSRKEVGI